MNNPFPGMNPYLEQPELWHQVHNRLIVAIADEITPQVVPQYHVAIEERVYSSVSDNLLVGIADVAVSRRNDSSEGVAVMTQELVQPTKVSVPVPEETTERFLEVRSTQSGEVVSVIEILSPKNKRSKQGREAYENKRNKILASRTNFIEIDLLRIGEPMLIMGASITDYSILVSRGYHRPEADLYGFNLKESIPTFPVPLKQGEQEPLVDLQKLLNEVYQKARFDLVIDYSQSVKPSLSAEDKNWVEEILK
ncbi:DUF4058 family protein [Calothrix sp. CCY 0018]|uniref:DUF4058 family protein n=1 Tax=Calothrix sp. CCY 0018 TaxID=3103864 RepID=UPI0039C6F787